MTYHIVKINKLLMFKISSKYLDVVLKASIISACLSSEKGRAQWLSGRVLDYRPRGRGFKPHCIVSLSKNIYSSLVLVQLRKTHPFITER